MKQFTEEEFQRFPLYPNPVKGWFNREEEWWSDNHERVLGVVALDLVDKDWSWVVLGKDESGIFRGIDLQVSISDPERARQELHTSMQKYSDLGVTVFSQGA
jgi:hypothetical protein